MEKFQLIANPLSNRIVEAGESTNDILEPIAFQTTSNSSWKKLLSACQWDELFDLTGWRVVCIHRATHRVAVAAEESL